MNHRTLRRAGRRAGGLAVLGAGAAPASDTASAPETPAPAAQSGDDFIAEVRLLFKLVA